MTGMKIFLREIKDQETTLQFTQADPWVKEAVFRIDEKLENETPQMNSKRFIEVQFSLKRENEVYWVSGTIETQIRLVCSRCANFYLFSCSPNFCTLYCKDPTLTEIGSLEKNQHQRGGAEEGDRVEFEKDMDITYISADFIDLSEIVSEQLLLQVPFQPLCNENCKGICIQCGKDLNLNPCDCPRKVDVLPFSVLKNLGPIKVLSRE